MQRIAAEIGSAADDLAGVEAQVASAGERSGPTDGYERLQALDRLGQQLRTLEAFLARPSPASAGASISKRRSTASGSKRCASASAAVARRRTSVAAEPELW